MATTKLQPYNLETSVLGYAEVTADQGTYTGETALTGLNVTVTIPPGGRRVRITGYIAIASSVADGYADVNIKLGTTPASATLNSGRLPIVLANTSMNLIVQSIQTPSAGSVTYGLTSSRPVGSGNITMKASATQPAFILVEVI